MSLIKGSSRKRHILEICLTASFAVCNFRNTKAMRGIFFLKIIKINLDIKNLEKTCEKFFVLYIFCIWIHCVKLSLLRRESVSSAVNVLKSVLGFCLLLRETFSNSNTFTVINKYHKDAVVDISTVFGTVYHVVCWRVFSNETF